METILLCLALNLPVYLLVIMQEVRIAKLKAQGLQNDNDILKAVQALAGALSLTQKSVQLTKEYADDTFFRKDEAV